MKCTKLKDWINLISKLYEKTLSQSLIDERSGNKDGECLKKIKNQYLDKGKDIMKSTETSYDEIFRGILG